MRVITLAARASGCLHTLLWLLGPVTGSYAQTLRGTRMFHGS
jgi:hypothetical protein